MPPDVIYLGDNLDFDPEATQSLGEGDGPRLGISRDSLLKHTTILGGTGSGKTVLAKVMLEELALSGVPSIVIDLQGDLAKLAEKPIEDQRADLDTLDAWRKGTEARVWTPVSESGLPISLDPFSIPPKIEEGQLVNSIDRMARGLTSILGYNASKPAGKKIQAHLTKHITELRKTGEQPLSFPELALSLNYLRESEFLSKNELSELIRRVEASTVGNQSKLYSLGPSLDVSMLMTPSASGRTPINIMYLNTLQTDELKQVFIQQLVRSVHEWMMQNPPSEEIQLALFLDEAAPYLPPDPRMPPAKEGLRLLMKQARKYGVGCILATQSPGDLDYRTAGQSNTMAIGRFTQPQEIKKIEQIVKSRDGGSLSALLPTIGAGRFLMFSPDNLSEATQMQTRWLITPHGRPLTVDEVAAITPKRLRDWSRKHSADGTSRKKSPFWMDKERSSGLPMASTPVVQEGQNPKPDPLLDPPLQMAYSHYNLERDGMSRLLILNSLALSVALFCSTSILLPGASTMSMAITGLGALLSAASLALLLTNLNQHSNSALNWFDQHSTKLEVLMLLYLSGLLGLNAGGYIDLGWSRWLVISSQTILLALLALDQIFHFVYDRVVVSGQSLGHRVRALRDFVTPDEKIMARELSERIFTRFGLFTNLITILFLVGIVSDALVFDSEIFYNIAFRVLSLEAIHFVTISSLMIRGD